MMNELPAERLSLAAADGYRVLVDYWPAENPLALIHIFHGLAEHTARYERFARACNAAGISVAAHSHRGHGENCDGDALGHFADYDGWDKVIDDAVMVQQHIVKRHPGLPLVLLGHSMGSYVAQSFMIRGHGSISALILSGSSFAPRSQLRAAHWLSRFERWRGGRRSKSPLLNKLGFGEFNKRFEPTRTAFDWLSRDEAEVDKYVNDPLCGADSSSQLWFDLTGGLLEVTSRRSLAKIDASLPILIIGGSLDPVGGRKGLASLADAYARSGHKNLSLKIYDEGRHEMLNEINRDEVTSDLISWVKTTLATQTG